MTITKKIIKFIVVSAVTLYLSANGLVGIPNATAQQTGNHQQTALSSTTKVDSFQYYVDDYGNRLQAIDKYKVRMWRAEKSINGLKKAKLNVDREIQAYDETIKCATQEEISSSTIIARLNKELTQAKDSVANILEKIRILQESRISYSVKRTKLESSLKKVIQQIQRYSVKIYEGRSMNFRGVSYYLFVANLQDHEVKFHLHSKDKRNYRNIGALKSSGTFGKDKPLMITNAGMYDKDNQPQGLYIEKHKILSQLNKDTSEKTLNFYMLPNGVFYIDGYGVARIKTTDSFEKKIEKNKKTRVKYATQSGPMLVIDGEMHKRFTYGSKNKKTRSGVGILDGNKVIFAISIDRTNFFDFATVFKNIFGCDNALFLDGAISLMYLSEINPNENGGHFGPMISVTKKK